jgi:hypothetical protein
VTGSPQSQTDNGNVVDLSKFLDLTPYPERSSDIVALMVLEHQTYMQNLLVSLNKQAETALHDGKPIPSLDSAMDATLKYMLFMDETQLKSPIRGTSGFAEWFQQQGPRDSAGRSLRQLDLQTRLFQFPCSYMIYSPSFDGLNPSAKKHLYHRLWQVLSGEDVRFASLSRNDARAIQSILIATKPDLPEYWRL